MTSGRTYREARPLLALALLMAELLRWMVRERLGDGAGYITAWARVWGRVSAAWPRGVERGARLAGRSASGVCACRAVPCRCARSVSAVELGGISSPRLVRTWARDGRGQRCPDGRTRLPGVGRAWRTPGEARSYGSTGATGAVVSLFAGARKSTLFYARFWRVGLVFTPRMGLPARDLGVVGEAEACAQGPPGG